MFSDKFKTMIGFGGEHGRANRIRDFVISQLKPKTRAELLNIIRIFPYDTTKSEEDLIIGYITGSNDDLFNMYRMKNDIEKGMLEAKEREETEKQTAYDAMIESEAKSYISHMIHQILDDDPRSVKYPTNIHLIANDVRYRVADIVKKIDYTTRTTGTYHTSTNT
jgi:hypothetical protein